MTPLVLKNSKVERLLEVDYAYDAAAVIMNRHILLCEFDARHVYWGVAIMDVVMQRFLLMRRTSAARSRGDGL